MRIKTETWNGYDIRFVEKEPGNWWAVAVDVTSALGIKNTSEAVNGNLKKKAKGLGESQKGICKLYTPGGEQEMLIVNEAGIYKLIFRSHKPEAEVFQDWVCDVIKSLRQASGLEGYQVFRMTDKEHQKNMMRFIHSNLPEPTKRDYIKANTVADKAISNNHGYPKMIKKDAMTPQMLQERQPILEDTVQLIVLKNKFGINVSVSSVIYKKYCRQQAV